MSGILDNKSRIIDVIVTAEGRRQLSEGGIRISHVSFTDAGTYYKADVASGSADATVRLHLEACLQQQDQITFEADDSGKLVPFPNADDVQVKSGQVVDYIFNPIGTTNITGSLLNTQILRGTEFASSAGTLLASSLNNFNRLQAIGTHDDVFEDDGFGVGTNDITFSIRDGVPVTNPSMQAVHINSLDSLFSDARMSRVANFQFLPPINKTDQTINKSDYRVLSRLAIGRYRPLGKTHVPALTYQQVANELQYYEKSGFSKVVSIDPTSNNNNLVCQMFEQTNDTLTKLDVIDFGKFRTGNHTSPEAHIFFAGKLLTDDNNTHTFIHLFTLVFQ